MKKILLSLFFLFACAMTFAQGLEGIIIEKYYVSNAADAAGSTGALPAGSVTYRIYVDMLPGYNFQALYGVATHQLKIQTSTTFFNNEDFGAKTPTISASNVRKNSALLDSYFSVGGAAVGKMGVLKIEDNDGSPGNFDGILQNADPSTGAPINIGTTANAAAKDGMIAGSPVGVTFVGLTTELDIFDATSQVGGLFVTNNGSIAALGGAVGPTTSNRVLVGQFTTNGTFCYELNIQIGTPGGGTENYVAQNATGGEILMPSLMGCIIPPTVSIITPLNNSSVIVGNVVNITATAADADGSVSSVEFFVDGVSIGNGVLGTTWDLNWTSTLGTHQLTALATDNSGLQTASAPVTINVTPAFQPYGIVSTSGSCHDNTFCVPIQAQLSVSNIIGYDLTLVYDKTKVSPTGVITVNNALVQPAYVTTAYSNNAALGKMNISLFFNASAPPSTRFSGIGNLLCVEFIKTGGFAGVDTAQFSVSTLQESYVTGVQNKGVDPGKFSSYKDSTFNASISFWADNSPIKYNALNPSQYLVTNVYGNNSNCNSRSTVAVQPDLAGSFVYNVNNGADVEIVKDIPGNTDVQPVINGIDALNTRKVLLDDLSFIPNVYQAIAMDVNMDGFISAGDLSQINQRTVLLIPEFKQSWNYDNSGNYTGAGASKDWVFVDVTRVGSNPAYAVSTIYPSDDGVGFSKSRVPQVPFCLPVPLAAANACNMTVPETYKAILLGDVNGNYSTVIPNGQFRMNGSEKVVYNLSKAVVVNGYVDVPVYVVSNSNVNALDFAIRFDESLAYHSVNVNPNVESLANYNAEDKTLRFTSNSLQNYDQISPVVTVRFATDIEKLKAANFNSLNGYINGERVASEVKDGSDAVVEIYPNPAKGILNIVVSENSTIQLMDVEGRQLILQTNVSANQKHEINTENIASGIYMIKISNDNSVTTKRVVINN